MVYRSNVLLVLFFLFCFVLPIKSFSKYSTRYFTVNNGISSNTINSIYQDQSGYMWIGTDDGLNLFDGYKFRIFRHEPGNNRSLSHNKILFIKEDSRGDLWVGTQKSISRYNRVNNTFYNYFINDVNGSDGYALSEKNIDQNQFLMFHMDSVNTLWTCISNGLLRVDLTKKTIETFNSQKGSGNIVGKRINRLLWLNKNELLVGSCDAGLEILAVQSKKAKWLKSLRGKDISFLAKGMEGKIWVGTYGNGLGILDVKNDQFKSAVLIDSHSERFRLNNILCGIKSSGNTIFIGSESGLFSYSDKCQCFCPFTDDNYFPSRPLVSIVTQSIFEDRDGNFWIGTYREGLIYIQKKASAFSVLKDLKPSSDKPMGYINAISENNKGILLASGENGILEYNAVKKEFSLFEKGVSPFKISSNETCYLLKHSSGKIWIGTPNAGVYMYDPENGQGRSFLFAPAEKNYNSGNQIQAIAEDTRGNVWIATEGDGIKILDQKFNVKHLRHKMVSPGISGTITSNWVRSLAADGNGDIWIGTSKGLCKYTVSKNKIFNFFASDTVPRALKDNTITQILPDKKGNIWLATRNGLHLLTNPNASEKEYVFKSFTTKNGLINNTIHAIVNDRNGDVWMTTNGGIAMLNVQKNSFNNYPFEELPIDFFCEKSACALSNGLIMFGGINKLIYFDPLAIQPDTHQLRAQISELRLFNQQVLQGDTVNGRILMVQPIDQVDKIELRYKEDVVSFLLSAIYFQDPNGLEFSYKMDGFDKQWSVTNAANRLITYTHLAPGEYTFRIKVKKNNGVEARNEKRLTICVLPPWWRTNFAYSLYLSFFFFLLWFYRFVTMKQLRLKQEVELQKEKSERQAELLSAKMEFYTNVSHEFKTPLTLIQGPVEKLIKEDSDAGRQKLYNLVRQNALLLKKYIDEILLFRKMQTRNQGLLISNQDFIAFMQPIIEAFRFQAQIRNVKLEVASDTTINAWFDKDKVEKILINLLSNAIKYTPENELVEMKIEHDRQHSEIRISIKDSGPGIPESEQEKIFEEFYQSKIHPNVGGTGIGLSLVKNLVILHKGSIYLSSEKDKGSVFTVILPIGKANYQSDELNGNAISKEEMETISSVKEEITTLLPMSHFKILIVDDNIDIRSFLKGELEKHYQVIEAGNGKLALSIAHEQRPDLIISDVMMPEMDGYQLCQYIKTNDELCATPVILLTAKTSEDSLITGLEFGADDYIAKPFNMEVLQIKVRNMLQQIEAVKKAWKVVEANNALTVISGIEHNEFLTKLVDAIEKEIENTDLTPALLGQILGISRTKLYTLVTKHTGYSVIDFIYIVKLRKAAELLPTGKYSVSEVAWKLGFKQHSHFTKRFTEHFGKAPSLFIP